MLTAINGDEKPRNAAGRGKTKRGGENGTGVDYTPSNAVSMVDQATIDYFRSQNPNLPFKDPAGYYKWMFGGGTVIPSTNPAQDSSNYFAPSSGDINKIVHAPLSYNPADPLSFQLMKAGLTAYAAMAAGPALSAGAGEAAGAAEFAGANAADLAMEAGAAEFAGTTAAGVAAASEFTGPLMAGPIETAIASGTAAPAFVSSVASGLGTVGGAAGGASLISNLKTVSSVLSPIASIVGAASGVSASKRMSSITNLPQVAPPITMPLPNSIQSMRAMQGSFASQLQRRGRASTILTAPAGDKLGA